MKILVGVTPDSSSTDALALAGVLQRVFDAEVVLGHIYNHSADRAGTTKVDLEWLAYLQADTEEIFEEALADAGKEGITGATTAMHGYHSSGTGLIQLAEHINANLIVIGSAPGSQNGRFLIGSTANQLLHGSHVPVALAPTGYRRVNPEVFDRAVVAFQDTAESRMALKWTHSHFPDERITALTLLIRHRIMGSNLSFDGEGLVVQQMLDDAESALGSALAGLGAQVDSAVSMGDDAQSAVQRFDWEGDEIFVLASASGGVLRRVFLGDMTYKLVRATPVPALVLPRHT